MNAKLCAAVAIGGLLVAACTNSGGRTTGPTAPGGPVTTASAADLTRNVPSSQPGVTDTEIRVASLGAVTNVVGADFAQGAKGTQAFFDMVNDRGGIYGRRLVLTEQVDDQMMRNKEQAEKLVSDNAVFAVLPVTAVLFTGAEALADAGIPTFGWQVSEEWTGAPNLFGSNGSTLCISCAYPHWSYTAREAGAERIAILAYGLEQGRTCAEGARKSFELVPGTEVVFVDDTIPLGNTDYSVQVQRMKDLGVDMAMSCSDNNSVISLAREIKKQGADTRLLMANGYESDLLTNFADVVEGSYIFVNTAPVEMQSPPKGLQEYKEWIAKVPGAELGEQTLTGWANAHLLYEGLLGAGPEFTQDSVVAAINRLTRWNAEGVVADVDWTKAHDQRPDPWCAGIVKVEGGKFVPVFGEPGKPFICLPLEGPLPEKATPMGA